MRAQLATRRTAHAVMTVCAVYPVAQVIRAHQPASIIDSVRSPRSANVKGRPDYVAKLLVATALRSALHFDRIVIQIRLQRLLGNDKLDEREPRQHVAIIAPGNGFRVPLLE